MLPNEFSEFVRRRPFRPFRMTLPDGRTYDIVHPDMAAVAFQSVIVGFPPKDESEADLERDVLVFLLHVMQVELINLS